ncbi:MAG: dTDP-4-dehydrorhamnose reductase [Proteobacteria bacterium]|nr:dTDP-4-dehydrorhamnose reductase [Pseudomonadota bacterium]
MSILVLGGAGQLGQALIKSCPPGTRTVGLTHADLDVGDAAAVDHMIGRYRPDWAINCAAYTAVDQAELVPDLARRTNALGPENLVSALNGHGGRLLHLSTDFVFDGASRVPYRPESAPHPLSVYGRTKLEGELSVLSHPGSIVLRTSWLHAAKGQNFPLTMLRLMRERDEVRVVNDQFGSPTWASGLASVIWRLIGLDAPGGIHHWSDRGIVSWYDYAVAIKEEALKCGILQRNIWVRPISTGEYPARARRPAFSALDCSATSRVASLAQTHWRDNLVAMLHELHSA